MPSISTIRLFLLLATLMVVAVVSAHQRTFSRNWNQPLVITVFPINADDHLATADYISRLRTADFAVIDRWGEREARRHDLDLLHPFRVSLGPTIEARPPAFPDNRPNAIDVLWWGLRFRWWAWRHTPGDDAGLTRVRLFVMYQQGEDEQPLAHSLGLQKGLLGLVHAFATDEQTAQNNIVIAHEILHTVGALDKYTASGVPEFPVGYAQPQREPLYPQRSAEIMAGRIPVSAHRAYMAESLRSVLINEHTAAEINWLQQP